MSSWVLKARDESHIEGITLLGGEPFAHAPAAASLAKISRELNLSTMVFSGYTLEELQNRAESGVAELLKLTDILVDGPYDREKPDTERRWIGSTNQRIHFLTNRYSFDDQWRQKNTLEIRLVGREISINGFPATDAVGLWKGWKRKKPPAAPRKGNAARVRQPASNGREMTRSAAPSTRPTEPEGPRQVSKFEFNLLRILRFIVGHFPTDQGLQLVRAAVTSS